MIYGTFFFHEPLQKHNVYKLPNTLKIAKIGGSRIGLRTTFILSPTIILHSQLWQVTESLGDNDQFETNVLKFPAYISTEKFIHYAG